VKELKFRIGDLVKWTWPKSEGPDIEPREDYGLVIDNDYCHPSWSKSSEKTRTAILVRFLNMPPIGAAETDFDFEDSFQLISVAQQKDKS
jgi:hypothetical protein